MIEIKHKFYTYILFNLFFFDIILRLFNFYAYYSLLFIISTSNYTLNNKFENSRLRFDSSIRKILNSYTHYLINSLRISFMFLAIKLFDINIDIALQWKWVEVYIKLLIIIIKAVKIYDFVRNKIILAFNCTAIENMINWLNPYA